MEFLQKLLTVVTKKVTQVQIDDNEDDEGHIVAYFSLSKMEAENEEEVVKAINGGNPYWFSIFEKIYAEEEEFFYDGSVSRHGHDSPPPPTDSDDSYEEEEDYYSYTEEENNEESSEED